LNFLERFSKNSQVKKFHEVQ